jgi:L-fucose mutarotase/ribose pyranase (RbsD/FucU family)
MTFPLKLTCLCLAIVSAGCANLGFHQNWKNAVNNEVNQLGTNNWIVIAEASFPNHSRPGVRLVNADAEIPEVTDYVINSLESTQYVRPKIYVTRELQSVEDDFAPGIEDLRKEIDVALHGHEPTTIEQESLLTLLESANQSFDVLVIRTSTALPYSSVFFELEPGYWDAHSEERLRRRISRERTENLAPPEP